MKLALIFLLLLIPSVVDTIASDKTIHKEFSELSQHEKREVECLTKNVYREARGEHYGGLMAVAFVTMNRTESEKFPSSICEVVYQKNSRGCQFSWACEKSKMIVNSEQYASLRKFITKIYVNRSEMKDPTEGALFYHANYVNPYWSKMLVKTKTIGNHIFYK